jgi:hypothetical protein
MALYAFDGTWNADEDEDIVDTNVVRFREIYAGADFEYLSGVGTRIGAVGRVAGGLFGIGGRPRIHEMYDALCANWKNGDTAIDIIGFSRGGALALHFANKVCERGIKADGVTVEAPKIRFLGLWDVVASFGIAFDSVVDFQSINLGWNVKQVAAGVERCYHAMALDERRETFGLTRLDPRHEHDTIREVWFRGVHSDVGGGNMNVTRSNIALSWMLDCARECGLPINEARAAEAKYALVDPLSPISENRDPRRDPRRPVLEGDEFHPTALSRRLRPGESHVCRVRSAYRYNWAGVELEAGVDYGFSVDPAQRWLDGDIECGAAGWTSDQLPWFKERLATTFERRRRCPEANWFELIGAEGDDDATLFRIGAGTVLRPEKDVELYLFANDLKGKYDNNAGFIDVTITRL